MVLAWGGPCYSVLCGYKVWVDADANTQALSVIRFLSQVEQSKVLVKEGGVQLLLTIVDTPGFGDAVDNSNW